MFNPQQISLSLIPLLGGKANINEVTCCMTRLRVTLNDTGHINKEQIKKIPGVLGVIESGLQLQIIFGPGKVNQVLDSLNKELAKDNSHMPIALKPDAQQLKAKISQKNSTPFKTFLKKIANVFIPLIPAFVGCGMILAIFNIILKTNVLGQHFELTSIGSLMLVMGNGLVFGLMLFTGLNVSREFGGTPIIGGVMGAILTMPQLANVAFWGEHLVPGRGGMFAVIVVAILAVHIEKFFRKIIPAAMDLFLTPMLTIVLSTVIAIVAIQPVSGLLSDGLVHIVNIALADGSSPIIASVSGFILGALFLPLVMTGLHQGLTPIHMQLIATTGVTVLLPILAMSGCGQVGAAIAVLFKTKNARLKHTIKSSLFVGFLGIGEPLIYGVTLPLFKPFIAACMGGAFGGAVVAVFHVGATGFGISGLPLTLLTNHYIGYLSGVLTAYAAGFILTYLIGFDDSIFDDN